MAKFTLTNAQVLVNSVDLSAWVKAVTINYSAVNEDGTAMGDLTKHGIPGLKDYSFELDVIIDEGAAGPNQTLFPLVGTVTSIDVKPVNGARSATNPSYYSSAVHCDSFPPIGSGQVGAVPTAKVTFKPAGAALQRLTS